jgi:hypothetical protein
LEQRIIADLEESLMALKVARLAAAQLRPALSGVGCYGAPSGCNRFLLYQIMS